MKRLKVSFFCLLLFSTISFSQENTESSGKNQYDYILNNILNTIVESKDNLWDAIQKGRLNSKFDEEFEKGLGSYQSNLLWNQNEGYQYSCDQVCPDSFAINIPFQTRMFPSNDKYLLSFTNDKGVFKDSYSRTIGYCWGHTTVTRNFNYLAYYDPYNSQGQVIPSRSDEKAWKEYFENKINNIMHYEAEIIPYYKDLYEMSADPLLKKTFKSEVIKSWYKQTLSFKNITHAYSIVRNKMTLKQVNKMLKKIDRYLAVGIAPKLIVYSQKPGFIHVVSTFRVMRNGDNIKVCLLDNHQFSDGLNRCQASIEITRNPVDNDIHMYYYGWDNPEKKLDGTVKRFELAFENDMEALKYKDELVKTCKKVTRCQ